ncbi:hypothetical protein WICPIJ_007582 [Wickerhamomyces pijperi]|uniref:Glycosyltransferase family 15 protein n=1 Tax=Wickerhamomyces pijperi TaxID=599730 RepID=A0A9P8TJX7_WICPI|nr:hypothetical protein WICPIJ_007582 [Wickerhamomyces pijperi]
MVRSDARIIRFAAIAVAVIVTIFLLSQGSSPSYISGGSSDSTKTTKPSSSLKSTVKSSGALGNKDYGNFALDAGMKKSPNKGTVKAAFVSLARNNDLWSLIGSIRHVEDRFNSKYGYDWVFLNDEPFSKEFIRTTTALITGETKYGLIPKEHWSFPEWIDLDKAAATRETMKQKKIIYGDSVSYRHMCRYESGFFYRHELMMDYDYYWRVEPDIRIYCDIDYDIFQFMKDNGKKYGFTISLHEYVETIPTLWKTTKEFLKENPGFLHKNSLMDFVSDDGGATYNLCHFWSNFEIGDLNFWRGEAYSKYFDYLDRNGGFFYERWGDAPIHSIAAALFLDKSEIHYFPDVGYYHGPFHNCPINDEFRLDHKCMCNPKDDFTFKGYSCGNKYYSAQQLQKPENYQDYQ